MKQLSAQNEKLRDTLVKMRDLSAHEKSEIMRFTKDLEEKQTQVNKLARFVLFLIYATPYPCKCLTLFFFYFFFLASEGLFYFITHFYA